MFRKLLLWDFCYDRQIFVQWQEEKGLLLSVRIKSRRSAGTHLSPRTQIYWLWSRVAFWNLIFDSTNIRVAFEDLLEELGPSILPSSHSHYQRLLYILSCRRCKRITAFSFAGLPSCRTNCWWVTGMFDRSMTSSGQWLLLIRYLYIGSSAKRQGFISSGKLLLFHSAHVTDSQITTVVMGRCWYQCN